MSGELRWMTNVFDGLLSQRLQILFSQPAWFVRSLDHFSNTLSLEIQNWHLSVFWARRRRGKHFDNKESSKWVTFMIFDLHDDEYICVYLTLARFRRICIRQDNGHIVCSCTCRFEDPPSQKVSCFSLLRSLPQYAAFTEDLSPASTKAMQFSWVPLHLCLLHTFRRGTERVQTWFKTSARLRVSYNWHSRQTPAAFLASCNTRIRLMTRNRRNQKHCCFIVIVFKEKGWNCWFVSSRAFVLLSSFFGNEKQTWLHVLPDWANCCFVICCCCSI